MGQRLLKALKTVNFISGKSMTDEELLKHRKLVEWVGRMATPKGDVKVRKFKIGDMSCETVKPDYAHNPGYAVIYAHGGGYMAGGLDYSRVLATKLAIATGFTTYSFDYRLAPEHPYPAALEDGMAVWDYFTKEKYAPDHILMAGDSAGGNLALCLVQKLLSENRPVPGSLLLFSPWTDMTGTSPSYEANKDIDPILSRPYVMTGARAYTGGVDLDTTLESESEKLADPRFSPIYGSFEGFPPTFIMAGKNGILLDDSIRLRDSINKSGGKASLDIEEEGWHVYQQMPIPIATKAMKRLSKYVSGLIYS